MDDVLLSLPKTMQERALWARKYFIINPQKSQIDDNLLVWCFNKNDNLWYSILGSYSSSSPEEKRIKEAEKLKRYEELNYKNIQSARDYYDQVLYFSEIRTKVLMRDNYTCQSCGKRQPSKLHIHHICKRRENGSDCLDNLITLCPKCHSKADGSEYNPLWKE